ncbi:hypothetical protein ACGFW5_01680 [Streptomyces sp. NPDC048416]|uniref:hypothetical protein n=1 Tax=Streptomyces sp. NPDC048416 TaxID=3365546 RepID=UPI003721AF38
MTTTTPTKDSERDERVERVERVHADHRLVKHIGDWTTAGRFEIRARSGLAVLDLRSPALPAEVTVHLELRGATVKLLVGDDTAVEHWDLSWTGRGRVKDAQSAARSATSTVNRRITLTGCVDSGEIRVARGGIAILAAMTDRAHLRSMRRAHEATKARTS